VTLLEASAGTGKTYAIAALVARFVADGVPPAQLLVVTFTRMATGELRERVRDRLVSAEVGLARALAGVEPPAEDRVLQLLADGSDAEVDQRQRRLADCPRHGRGRSRRRPGARGAGRPPDGARRGIRLRALGRDLGRAIR
jgi:hypothetical protein